MIVTDELGGTGKEEIQHTYSLHELINKQKKKLWMQLIYRVKFHENLIMNV
jgi:hypothetical protein